MLDDLTILQSDFGARLVKFMGENTDDLNSYKIQITTVEIQINKINIQQDKISIALLQDYTSKPRKRRKMFDDEIDDNHQNKKTRKSFERRNIT